MTESVYIERMSYGPDAVGRLSSGKTVFVRGAAPGETVDVRIVEDKPRYAKAVVVGSGAEADAGKRPGHDSPIAALSPWAHLPYETQLAQKRSIVDAALGRVGHFAPDEVEAAVRPIVGCKDPWGYRNKLELAATVDGRGRFALGFHDEGSAAVEPAEACPLGNRLIERAPKALAGALRYLAGGVDLGVYRVGIRGSLSTKSVEVALWTPPGPFPRSFAAKMLVDAVGATSVVRVLAEPGRARKVKRVEVLEGEGHWDENLMVGPGASPVGYAVSAPSFFQVNTKQAAKLVGLALDGLALRPGDVTADLYSGVGTFSIPLALAGVRVAAIELEGSAARDLRRNAAAAGVDVDVVCDDVARALPGLAKRHGKRHGQLDALVVDPPRAGLDKRALDHVVQAAPARIAYISCDPQTLARDAARLAQRGYRLQAATPVDLFPQTYHVETVSLFVRT